MEGQRSLRVLRIARRIGVALIAASWLACIEVPGEVAETGTCPEGESCVSTEGEAGLRFSGEVPDDLIYATAGAPRIYPTAVGGTQRIWFGTTLADAQVTAEPSSVLVVESQGESSFVVRGISAGSATVSVRDPSGGLYDRITLQVAEVESIVLRPVAYDFGPPGSPDLEWSFFRDGGEVTVIFALQSAAGERLVDRSALPVASEGVAVESHDTATLTLPVEGDMLSLPITLGSGELREGTAPLASSIDRWTRMSDGGESLARAPSIRVGGGISLCFVGMSGERAVHGVPLAVELDELLELGDYLTYGIASCVELRGQAAGMATAVVRGGGAQLSQTVFVE